MAARHATLPTDEPSSGVGIEWNSSAQRSTDTFKYKYSSALPKEGRIGLVWAAGRKPDADALTPASSAPYRQKSGDCAESTPREPLETGPISW